MAFCLYQLISALHWDAAVYLCARQFSLGWEEVTGILEKKKCFIFISIPHCSLFVCVFFKKY